MQNGKICFCFVSLRCVQSSLENIQSNQMDLPPNPIDSIFRMVLMHFHRIIVGISWFGRLRFDHRVWDFAELIFSHASRVDQIELQMFRQFTWPNSWAALWWWSRCGSDWIQLRWMALVWIHKFGWWFWNVPILSMASSLAIVVIFTFDTWIHSVVVTSALAITPIKQLHWTGWLTMARETASAAFIFWTGLGASMTWTMTSLSMWIMWATRSTGQLTLIVWCSTISMALSNCEMWSIWILSFVQEKRRPRQINAHTHLLHAFESFDEWLSTELDRMRCVGTLEFFRDDAERTDLGLEVTPNKPFCWDRDQGALRVLRGESGALALP